MRADHSLVSTDRLRGHNPWNRALLAWAMLISASVVPGDSIARDVSSSAGAQSGIRASQRAPRHISLLIGIGDYQHFGVAGRPGETDLKGPLNDVERVRTSIRRWGFGSTDDTRVLTNSQASRAALLDALRWLATRATDSMDVVVVFYSGHGSFARDLDGDETRVTPGDTLDEAFVPWDVRNIHDGKQLLLDDQLRATLAALGTKNVTVLVDACYSGTSTRGPEEEQHGRAKGPIGPGAGSDLDGLHNPEHTLITAASPYQIALERFFRADNKVFGIFTYYLTRALDAASPNTRYDELMHEIRLGVSGAIVPQTAQLEGDRGARLFRVRGEMAHRPFGLITAADSGRFDIDLGAVHGVRDSAIFDVFSPGELMFRGTPLAQLRVESVGEKTSRLRVARGTGRVPLLARGVVASVPLGAERLHRLPVYVTAPAARAQVERLDFVRVVNDPSAAETHVDGSRVTVRGIPLPPAENGNSLCALLSRAFSIAALELIQNPQPPDFDVRVRVVPSGTLPSDDLVTLDSAFIGESYDIYARVDAPADARLFLSAAVAGYSSEPSSLYPPQGTQNQLIELNRWVRIAPPITPTEPAGLEVIKVLVDSKPYHFDVLIDSFPKCGQTREARAGGTRSDDSPILAWKNAEHRVLILPPKRP